MIDTGVCYDVIMEGWVIYLILSWLLFQIREQLRRKIRESVRLEIHSPPKAHAVQHGTQYSQKTLCNGRCFAST